MPAQIDELLSVTHSDGLVKVGPNGLLRHCCQTVTLTAEASLRGGSCIAATSPVDYVFHNSTGQIGRHSMYDLVRRYLVKAGIKGPKLGPHRLFLENSGIELLLVKFFYTNIKSSHT